MSANKRKNNKTILMRLVSWLHLWPSLVSMIIVVFVCLTGTILVYCDEIIEASAGEAKYVIPVGEKLTLEELFEIQKKEIPGILPSYVLYYNDSNRSVVINGFDPKNIRLSMIYMNPYTGEVLKYDKTIHFFFAMAHLHAEMLLGPVGRWIIGIATIIFVLSTLTGLVLWWPRRWTRSTRQASFTIKWKAKFKRLNYDLHNVFGFYSLILCFVLGTTGLILFFQPMMDLTMKSFGATTVDWHKELPKADSNKVFMDAFPVMDQTFKEYPKKKVIKYWVYDYHKSGVFAFHVADMAGLKSDENNDILYFDKYDGTAYPITQEMHLHNKVENWVWQLHMGQWLGQIGKFSTFIAGVISTSLPITGFLIWWGRRKKKKKNKLA